MEEWAARDPLGWAWRAILDYRIEFPDDPQVLRFNAALGELRRTLEGLTDGDS